MNLEKIFFVIIFSLFLFGNVSAFSVLNIYLDESGNAVFLGDSDSDIVLPSGVSIENGEITGVTPTLTSKVGEIWTFSFNLEESEINVFLPENAVIKEVSESEIFLDGKKIVIYGEDFVSISYTLNEDLVIKEEKEGINVPLLMALIFALVILIVYVINYSKRDHHDESAKHGENHKRELLKQVLNDREKLILEKLGKFGKLKSSYLRRLCDIPKASFSRHVQELEKKGLVKRSGEGKNKFVEIVE